MFFIHGPLLCRRHHAPEQGMGLARQGAELRVELAGGEVGVVLELDQFDQATIRGSAADLVARFEKQVAVGVVEFVAVAVLRLSPLGFGLKTQSVGSGRGFGEQVLLGLDRSLAFAEDEHAPVLVVFGKHQQGFGLLDRGSVAKGGDGDGGLLVPTPENHRCGPSGFLFFGCAVACQH